MQGGSPNWRLLVLRHVSVTLSLDSVSGVSTCGQFAECLDFGFTALEINAVHLMSLMQCNL